MMNMLLRYTVFVLFAIPFFIAPALAADHIVEKYPFALPPSASLTYVIKGTQSGIPVSGQGLLRWQIADNKYTVLAQTRVLFFGIIMESGSDGLVDDAGLAPQHYFEKSFRKEKMTTRFNRERKLISFSQSSQIYPILGGEQDRTSVTWQLASIVRAAPEKFSSGTEWTFFVAGRRDAEPWTFKVIQQESIQTQLGIIKALHLSRAPPPDSKKQQLDLWFAPSLEGYPVQIRFLEGNGNFVEQKLEKIDRL